MSYRKIKSSLLGAVCALALCGAVWGDAPQRLDVPAGDLVTALETLTKQVDVELVFKAKELKGLKTEGVKGTYPVRDAVEALLKGTGLSVQTDAKGVMLIQARPNVNGASTGSAADQMRVTLVTEQNRDGGVSGRVDARDTNQITVQDKRISKVADRNVDIPRTNSDPQPYYIFDAETIEKSGTTGVGDFLKRNLSMNTAVQNFGESDSTVTLAGTGSRIDLRNLGTDQTLILVNGRRMAGALQNGGEYQPDLNGIPTGAIDRIEVLPSSASAIYGASAVGGVVNVVLKSNYNGGDVKLSYGNTASAEAPILRAFGTYGATLEGGRTSAMLSVSHSTQENLTVGDRESIIYRNIDMVMRNNSSLLLSAGSPPSGSTINIASQSGQNLVLRDGTVLSSPITHLPSGFAPNPTVAALNSALAANAGTYNLSLPDTTQGPFGLKRELGATPDSEALMLTLRRKMSDAIDAFAEISRSNTISSGESNPITTTRTISANAPSNPFRHGVRVSFPVLLDLPVSTKSVAEAVTIGLHADFPGGWFGGAEHSWSRNELSYSYTNIGGALSTAFSNGTLNPFVDTLRYPLDFQRFLLPTTYAGTASLNQTAVRGSGPMRSLPWGAVPTLAVGLERRKATHGNADQHSFGEITFGQGPVNSNIHYFGRTSTVDSLYAEATLPLIPADRASKFIHALDMQLAGRAERFRVDTGTTSVRTVPERNIVQWSPETPPNGVPVRSQSRYKSVNPTLGMKYQPVKSFTFRASYATAFRPPTYGELLPNFLPSTSAFILDPLNPDVGFYSVQAIAGGNPALEPQRSKSVNAGLIWTPHYLVAQGTLRVNLEYYRVRQLDSIRGLDGQELVDNEGEFSGRVTRDSVTGLVTLLDTSLANIGMREVEGYDLNLDYSKALGDGAVSLHLAGTLIAHDRIQISDSSAVDDIAGWPNVTGGAPKYKANATASFEQGPLGFGWFTQYVSSYGQFGAPGTPYPFLDSTYVLAQGSNSVSSQIYHDVFMSVNVDSLLGQRPESRTSSLAKGVKLQAGIKNVFNSPPAFDAFQAVSGTFLYNPYADIRLRSYWVTFEKAF